MQNTNSRWRLSIFFLLLSSLTYGTIFLMPNEYQVKAVYLFNFSKFMRWPKSAFDNPRTPIRICVLGKNPFEDFDILVRNKIVKKRRIAVEHFYDFRKTDRCHILFLSKSEQGNQATILSYVQYSPILTVSDIDNFIAHGGMIQFYMWNKKVRFMVNPEMLQKAGIGASANLLRVAKIVR